MPDILRSGEQSSESPSLVERVTPARESVVETLFKHTFEAVRAIGLDPRAELEATNASPQSQEAQSPPDSANSESSLRVRVDNVFSEAGYSNDPVLADIQSRIDDIFDDMDSARPQPDGELHV